MRVCFVADVRSPIARNWISHFGRVGHEVHTISSYPCNPFPERAASFRVIPVAFSGLSRLVDKREPNGKPREAVASSAPLLTKLRGGFLARAAAGTRYRFAPLDVLRVKGQLRRAVEAIRPDLVHAMRIPYEGALAAEALRSLSVPLLVSVWGNDFTLFARRYPLTRWMTRRALQRASALHADCRRDVDLAIAMGFDVRKPARVLPGSGGVQMDLFRSGPVPEARERWGIAAAVPVVLNPRGVREYVRTDTFFRAIPGVLSHRPDVVFVAPGMRGNTVAERWVKILGVHDAVRLLPTVSRPDMADLFRMASVTVSPSEHDGTPNTLLEAMACASFPVVGDIESVREWIVDGVNGLLFEPGDPDALAAAIVRALADEGLRCAAATRSRRLIEENANYARVMESAEAYYRHISEIGTSA